MMPSLGPTVAAHGVTGTWLDELIEIGLPVIILGVMYWWSSRKAKREASEPKKPDE